jgi:hypothetical protein
MLGLPEKKVRKVVQIIEFDGKLVRLCDDGTVWYMSENKWKLCPDVPQGDE